jgi:hypothetical protein
LLLCGHAIANQEIQKERTEEKGVRRNGEGEVKRVWGRGNAESQATKNPPRRVFLILAEGLLSRR